MPEQSVTLRLRVELKALREQIARMSEEHQSKKSVDFKAAHFAASMHMTEVSSLVEKLSLAASQGPSEPAWCNVPDCNCHVKEG